MRTRSKTTVSAWSEPIPSGTQNILITLCDGSHATTSTVHASRSSVPVLYVDEYMADMLGRGASHQVKHRKKSVDKSTDYSSSKWPNGSPYGVLETTSGEDRQLWRDTIDERFSQIDNWDLSHPVSLPPRWTVDLTNVNESAQRQNVLESAKQLKADVLLDVVEGNQIWPSITGLCTTVPKLVANVWHNKFRTVWAAVNAAATASAGTFLAYKFGVAPLISDMKGIARYLPSLKADIVRHINNDSKTFSSLANGIPHFDDTIRRTLDLNGFHVYEQTFQGRITRMPVIRYVLVVKPNAPKYLTSAVAGIDTLMRRFASSPASLAWELVPFSFVADWFVDLRGILNAIDKGLGVQPYKIVSFTRSYTYGFATDTFAKQSSPCDGALLSDRKVGSCEFSHYERRLVSDESFDLSLIPQSGKNHAAIAAALLTQMITKHF